MRGVWGLFCGYYAAGVILEDLDVSSWYWQALARGAISRSAYGCLAGARRAQLWLQIRRGVNSAGDRADLLRKIPLRQNRRLLRRLAGV